MTKTCPHCKHVGELEPDGDYPAGSYRWVCVKCGKTPYSKPVRGVKPKEVQMSEPTMTYDELTIPGKLYIVRDALGIVRHENNDSVSVHLRYGEARIIIIRGEEETDAIWKWLKMRKVQA